jgi:hypothetical protein
MKKFLTKILIYGIITCFICFLLQLLADKGLQSYKYDNYGEWNKIFNGTINSNIIVLGSSRALVQYDPKIIEEFSGLSCYNFGISGGRFILQNAKWETYLGHNDPATVVIQNVDILMLLKEKYIFGKEQFIPYLSEPAIFNNLKELDENMWLEKIIPLYKYRGLRYTFMLGLKSYFGLINKTRSNLYKGYAPADKDWNQDFEEFKAEHEELIFNWDNLEFGFNYIRNLIKECKNRNINFILVHAPMYHDLQEMIPQKDSVNSIFAEIADSNNIPFWDYSSDSICYSKEYFYNSSHLNVKGAEIFSNRLAIDLRNYIVENNIKRYDTQRGSHKKFTSANE